MKMQINQLCNNIIAEEMDKETLLKIYKENLIEKIQSRVKWMVIGIESVEINDKLTIRGYHPIKRDENNYHQYKDIEVSVDGYLVYHLIGHTGEYFIQSRDSLIQVEQNILGSMGLNNMFTTEMIVLLDGKVKRYYVMSEDGNVLLKEQIECMSLEEISKLKIVWEA